MSLFEHIGDQLGTFEWHPLPAKLPRRNREWTPELKMQDNTVYQGETYDGKRDGVGMLLDEKNG